MSQIPDNMMAVFLEQAAAQQAQGVEASANAASEATAAGAARASKSANESLGLSYPQATALHQLVSGIAAGSMQSPFSRNRQFGAALAQSQGYSRQAIEQQLSFKTQAQHYMQATLDLERKRVELENSKIDQQFRAPAQQVRLETEQANLGVANAKLEQYHKEAPLLYDILQSKRDRSVEENRLFDQFSEPMQQAQLQIAQSKAAMAQLEQSTAPDRLKGDINYQAQRIKNAQANADYQSAAAAYQRSLMALNYAKIEQIKKMSKNGTMPSSFDMKEYDSTVNSMTNISKQIDASRKKYLDYMNYLSTGKGPNGEVMSADMRRNIETQAGQLKTKMDMLQRQFAAVNQYLDTMSKAAMPSQSKQPPPGAYPSGIIPGPYDSQNFDVNGSDPTGVIDKIIQADSPMAAH